MKTFIVKYKLKAENGDSVWTIMNIKANDLIEAQNQAKSKINEENIICVFQEK